MFVKGVWVAARCGPTLATYLLSKPGQLGRLDTASGRQNKKRSDEATGTPSRPYQGQPNALRWIHHLKERVLPEISDLSM